MFSFVLYGPMKCGGDGRRTNEERECVTSKKRSCFGMNGCDFYKVRFVCCLCYFSNTNSLCNLSFVFQTTFSPSSTLTHLLIFALLFFTNYRLVPLFHSSHLHCIFFCSTFSFNKPNNKKKETTVQTVTDNITQKRARRTG